MAIARHTPVTLDAKYFAARKTMKLQPFHPDTQFVLYEDLPKETFVRVAPDYAVTRFESIKVPRDLVQVIEVSHVAS
jgi:hypothetical protein